MGVHSDIKLSFYFCALPQHYKESSCLSLLKCSERKVIFVCYPNIYWCDSQVICLIKVCNPSFILSVSLSSRFPTLHPNSLHSPSLHHTSMHLTGMCRVLTVNHILALEVPWPVPWGIRLRKELCSPVKAPVQAVTTDASPPRRVCWGSAREGSLQSH